MSETTENTTTATLTRDDYIKQTTDLIHFLNVTLTNRKSWCVARHRYFSALLPGIYSFDYDAENYDDETEPIVNFESVPEDSAALVELQRQTRGKLLWYTSAGMITLEDAQEILEAGSLAPYKTTGKRFSLSMELTLNVAVPEGEDNFTTRQWLQVHGREMVQDRLDGRETEVASRYVPGSVTIYQSGVSRASQVIEEQDMITPSYQ